MRKFIQRSFIESLINGYSVRSMYPCWYFIALNITFSAAVGFAICSTFPVILTYHMISLSYTTQLRPHLSIGLSILCQSSCSCATLIQVIGIHDGNKVISNNLENLQLLLKTFQSYLQQLLYHLVISSFPKHTFMFP